MRFTDCGRCPPYQNSKELGGSIHAVGGVADHVHVIAEVPASLAIAAYIKQLKGSSSRYLNVTHPMPDAKFKWQHEYGAFSLSQRNLTIAIAYVESQPQHHAAHTTIALLEPDAFFPTHRPESTLSGLRPKSAEFHSGAD